MANAVPPYGNAIQDAIASGDQDRMKQVADEAEKYLQEYGDIGEGLRQLRAALGGSYGAGGAYGGGIHTLYGPALRAAAESGDTDKLKALAQQAEDALRQADDVRTALEDVRDKLG